MLGHLFCYNRRMEIDKQTARRFILHKLLLDQPLLGEAGDPLAAVCAVINHLGVLQIDTISVVARNQDLALHSRISDYQAQHLDQVLYGPDRRFVETLYPLYVWPLADYRYIRQPQSEQPAWWQWGGERSDEDSSVTRSEREAVLELVLNEIVRRGPLSSRDFEGRPMIPGGFNQVKDVSQAISHLWRGDRIFTAYRRSNVRYFDLAERVLPSWVDSTPVASAEAKRWMAVTSLRILALASSAQWQSRFKFFYAQTDLSTAERKQLWADLTADGTFAPVQIVGVKSPYYLLAEDVPLLEQLASTPLADDPQAALNLQFIAPLDNLMWERGRIADLFEFDYIWEVYVPAVKRRWGYYVLPILYGNQLVGRLDPKAERKAKRLLIHSLHLEPAHAHLASDPAFRSALAAALHRFMHLNGATQLAISHAEPPTLLTLAL